MEKSIELTNRRKEADKMQIKVYWCSFCGGPLESAEVYSCPHCHVGLRGVHEGSYEGYQEAKKRFARRRREFLIAKVKTAIKTVVETVVPIVFELFMGILGLAILVGMGYLLCLGFRAMFVYYHSYVPSFAFTLIAPAIFLGAAIITFIVLWITDPMWKGVFSSGNVIDPMTGIPLPFFPMGIDLNDYRSQIRMEDVRAKGRWFVLIIWCATIAVLIILAGGGEKW